MVSDHASSHPRGFQFGVEPLSLLDVFPRRFASREDIKLRYRFKPHWKPLGCEEAWSDTIVETAARINCTSDTFGTYFYGFHCTSKLRLFFYGSDGRVLSYHVRGTGLTFQKIFSPGYDKNFPRVRFRFISTGKLR